MKFAIVLFAIFVSSSIAIQPTDERFYCKPVNPIVNGEVECVPSQPNGLYVLCDTCTYNCTAEGYRLKQGAVTSSECRPAVEDPSIVTEDLYVFQPPQVENPCERDPNVCIDRPKWDETPPAPGKQGTVDCSPLTDNEPSYDVEFRCDYICPPNTTLKGVNYTKCTSFPDGGRFTPSSPCCEENCPATDILFVVDWSTSIDKDEWGRMKTFVSGITKGVESSSENANYAVEVFGFGVRTNLDLKFQSYSDKLISDMETIAFNERIYGPNKDKGIPGTYINTALAYATQVVFGSNEYNDRKDPSIRDVVVFITDGASTDGRVDSDIVKALNSTVDQVFAVGIGLGTLGGQSLTPAQQDLLIIAGGNTANRLEVAGFSSLTNNTITDVIKSFCPRECEGHVQRDLEFA